MHRWGAKWMKNGKRPYFEGHERDDVVHHRTNLISYLKKNQYSFYQQNFKDSINWIPTRGDKPITLICHDESTCNAGNQQSHKWSFGYNSAFFDKNRGRSKMLSYFCASIQMKVF